MHIIPQLRDLQKQFPNSLVIVGVHSPKFVNERSDATVKEAVLRYRLDHPVVSDSQMTLWRTLGVQVWPTVVLVDPDGYIAGFTEGEGVEESLLPVIRKVSAAYRAVGRLDEKPLALSLESARAAPSVLSFPSKVLVDTPNKRLFIADSGHDRILITSLTGTIQEIAGSGQRGRKDGAFGMAQFNWPQGMALVGGLLYVADTNNHLIRALDLRNKTVKTIAGTGLQGLSPVGSPTPLKRNLSSPWDVNWFNGSLYIAMAGDHLIWRYQPPPAGGGQGAIEVYAGSGQEARQDGSFKDSAFAQPSGLANDGHFLYVADSESSTIRRIDPQSRQVETLAGGDLFDFGHKDGSGQVARFQHPLGIAYEAGKLYITDTYNSDLRILDLQANIVTTVAGATSPGNSDGSGAAARFYEPGGDAVSGDVLYVADTDNGEIRTVSLRSGKVSRLVITKSGSSEGH